MSDRKDQREENTEKQNTETRNMKTDYRQEENGMVHLRPHHGLCLLNFRGKGYSDDFSRNMAGMQEKLEKNPGTLVCITKGADDLCARCPNRRGSACTSEHPPLFDANVLRMTGFHYGQILPWKAFSGATRPLVRCRLEETCPDCEWLSLCQEIVKDCRGKA